MNPTRLALAVLILAAGREPAWPQTVLGSDGRQHFTQAHANASIACGREPVQVDASRVDLKIVGPCRRVVVAGHHNDIAVDVRPGGLVEITGTHNDVTWRQIGRGPRPLLLDHGEHNTFHPSQR